MSYDELLAQLQSLAEKEFADYQRRLIPTECVILGVRTPALRQIAKEWYGEEDLLLSFPNDYYEIRFLKLAVVANFPYMLFFRYVERVVPIIDNWALCDSFRPKCAAENLDTFLPYIEKFFAEGSEFYVRYALVMLLSFYVKEEYLSLLIDYLKRTNTQPYYVHMAAAWLTAEVLVKAFETGVTILKDGILDVKTHNKAIQKALESFRLNKKQKARLRALKIKN